ncbi:hypothetical protein GCM10009681_03170 [Luedemannella helvata]|uniref:Uncharacterized protein n=2 Tax=Luedemannella helvata TaxID=349315 RepID=A0ABP4VUJ7_9ACTN
MAGIAALLTACGDGDEGTSATSDGQGGFAAYQECLAQQGITLPSWGQQGQPPPSGSRVPRAMPEGGGAPPGGAPPGGGGFMPEGVDQETWQKAQEACAPVRPSGGPGGFGGDNSAFAAYRNCLAENGVSGSAGPGQLTTADPKVAAAEKVCAALRPSGRPGGGAPPTPSAN